MDNKKKKLVIEYFVIVFSIVLVFLIFGSFLVKGYNDTKEVSIDSEKMITPDKENKETEKAKPTVSTISKEKEVFKRFNTVIYGVDYEENLTDVMFVVNFDTKTKNINLITLPRDTRVKIPNARAQAIRNRGRYLPTDGYVKLNEVHSYAGKTNAVEYSTKQIEELLDIKIDYYIKMNLAGFKNIVDAIGGVDMDVPQKMDYEDPEQDLYIHLKKGQQLLNGKDAEQLVRFRGYPQADLMRVNVQQVFIKELMKKVLNKDNLISSAPKLIYNVLRYVTTNFKIEDALEYMKYIEDIKLENVTMKVLPGEESREYGPSYFINDTKETKIMVNEFFLAE